ncbi:MAG: hypothetical protein MUC72_10015 [Acidobacteria bacterium]|jgi:hypothetical protein|nr:hypothetical protein [Acidobacteriota bacterium]
MTEQAQRPAGPRRRWRWFYYFLLPLAALSLLLHVARAHRASEVRAAGERYAALVAARPIAATKAERARFYKARYFLGYPMSVSYTVADLLRRVAEISAPLQLLDAQVDPGLHGLEFTLTVQAAAHSAPAARRRFAEYFSRLESLPGVVQASFSTSGQGAADGGAHVFTVSGRAEWQ